jgi:hypothetical protein
MEEQDELTALDPAELRAGHAHLEGCCGLTGTRGTPGRSDLGPDSDADRARETAALFAGAVATTHATSVAASPHPSLTWS